MLQSTSLAKLLFILKGLQLEFNRENRKLRSRVQMLFSSFFVILRLPTSNGGCQYGTERGFRCRERIQGIAAVRESTYV
jgi:hypothetical protein